MGIVSGFAGGVGDSAEFIGKHYLTQQSRKEMDEANALREGNLRSSEREASQEFKAGESAKTRASAEKIAGIKKSGGSAGMSLEDRQKGANRVISEIKAGNLEYREMNSSQIAEFESEIYNQYGLDETGEKLVTKTSSASRIKHETVPTTADEKQARDEAAEQAGWTTSNKRDFGEAGKSAWIKKRAVEIAENRTSSKKAGIVGSEAKPAKKAKSSGVPAGHIAYMKKNKDDKSVVKQFRSKYPELTDAQFNELIGK